MGKRILIICTGNSCRSQMAHGFLQSFDSFLEVYSAGTHPSGGVCHRAIKVMLESGINIFRHTSDHVNKYLTEDWDYVITVCDNANECCPPFAGEVKRRLHMGFYDPYESDYSEYRQVRDEIKARFYELFTTELKEK